MSMGGATLLMALIVAVMASRHVNRLQREIERQRAAEQQNRQDLERLSARLVDAQEEERRRLARELHDEVGQALTAVKMDIGIALRAEIERGPRTRSKRRARSPRRRCAACATCRSCCTRRCSTISACRRRCAPTCATSRIAPASARSSPSRSRPGCCRRSRSAPTASCRRRSTTSRSTAARPPARSCCAPRPAPCG